MTIADRIRNRRIELGLSVDDLARLLNKNRATVYRYESNYIKNYSPDVITMLAEALHTTPAYLYGYDEPPDDPVPNVPITREARIVSGAMDKLPQEQREQILNVVRAMLTQHPELFE